MSELSIFAAAAECPDACALIAEGRAFSYAELAQRVRDLALPDVNVHRARPTLDTALLLYASLQARRAIALLSPGCSDAELGQRRQRVPVDLPLEIALILFTSGSSASAKGVLLPRTALVASAEASARRLGWYGDDRWLCALPLSHIGGLSILLRCLIHRKTAVLCPSFDVEEVARRIASERITHISLVPTMLWRLVEAGVRSPKHLRVTLIGGAAVAPELVERARSLDYALRLSYGMTETASQIVCDGRPLPGVQLRLREQRLEIKAPMLMRGYLPPDRAPLCEGWFRSQDRALLREDGSVHILGRADELIISGGENIDPRQVEAKLDRHPQIRASYALGLPHPEWGQALVALVVPRGQRLGTIDPQALGLIGPLKPKALIPVAELPLLENGKIDRSEALRIAMRLL